MLYVFINIVINHFLQINGAANIENLMNQIFLLEIIGIQEIFATKLRNALCLCASVKQ